MLLFLTSRLGGWLIIGLLVAGMVGGLIWHLHATASKLVDLNRQVTLLGLQAKSLQAANDALQGDIATVAQAQAIANQTIDLIRQQAAIDARNLANRTFNPNDGQLQQKINKETADTFKRLEDASHAP